MPGDLHTHTTFSDASCRIEQLPRLAAAAGMTHLAVSDHDTALAVRWAYAHQSVCGVALIPAVELTAFDTARARRVHILCYWPKLTQELCAFFDLMARRRNSAAAKSFAQLEALYPQFSREAAQRYAADAGVTYKTHMMRVLYDFAYTDGIYKELYGELFGVPNGKVLHGPAYESVETVLALIRSAGGVAVLAHPSVYQSMELACELAQQGAIDGVEIDHPRNTPEDKQALRILAKKHDLIVTGGTDFHGMYSAHPLPLGTLFTQDEQIARLAALAASRKKS